MSYLQPAELSQYLEQFQRIFLVCGRSFCRSPEGAAFAALGERVVSFRGFAPNPRYEEVMAGVERFCESECGLIAAGGGGSAMDTAKCIRQFAGSCVPLLAIPTTAGSGSEATHFAVIYRQGVKQSVDCGLPDTVLLDPALLDTLPSYQRKATLLDALCHGVESCWSVRATAESLAYACQAVRQIMDSYAGYLNNCPEGNEGMLQAAHLAGKAINLSQTTAGHAMCYPITKRYGLAHGHAAALCAAKLWPYVLERRETAMLAEAMGCDRPQDGAARFQAILDSLALEVPACTEEELAWLTASVNPERLKNFPAALTGQEIQALYRKILGGSAEL